jgi:hypothetical protein
VHSATGTLEVAFSWRNIDSPKHPTEHGGSMPTDPTEEDLERQIEALKSGKFKWIQPGGYVDMTAERIKDLTKQLEKLRAKKRDNFLGG